MDEKPECSQYLEPITEQPTRKNEDIESENPKNQLVFSKEQSPAAKTVSTNDQSAYSEDHSDAAKTLTSLTTDQCIYSTDQLTISPEQPILSINQPICSPEQQICSPFQLNLSTEEFAFSTDQPILSPNQPVFSLDQQSYLTEILAVPKDQLVVSTDQSINSTQQPVLLAEQPINLTETPEFSKDQPIYSQDKSAIQKTQTVLTKSQSIYSTDVCVFSKEIPGYSKNLSNYLKIQTASTISYPVCSKDKPAETDQLIDSLIQPNQREFTKEKPSYSKHQTAACSKDQSAFLRTHESFSLEEQIGLSTIHIDSTISESSFSRELLITPRVVEAASTKYVSVFPKNEVTKLLGNSINIDYEISLCAARETAATSSYNAMKNGYFLNANAPWKINMSTQSPSIPDSMSLSPMPASVAITVGSQPASLFLQALSKLNESSLTLAVMSHFRLQSPSNLSRSYTFLSGDITPPDSLTSAPPTYSFVLRQIAGRRRPRFMGSFFPSPSFVQRTPPPTYTGAFDVYVEPPLPPPPIRTYSLGYNSMPVICPECGYTGMTVIKAHVTVCTHCCAFILCILCCWICAPLPYLLTSCKDVYHYCRNCRSFLGMYCPSNPDATSMYPTDLNS